MKTPGNRNLELNRFFYEHFLKRKIKEVRDKLDDLELLKRIAFLSGFAWRNHTGYFFDSRLENILYEFGGQLESHLGSDSLNRCRKQSLDVTGNEDAVIHLATRLFEVGGHTRVLYQMVKRNNDPRQLILLTDQALQKVPEWFRRGIEPVKICSLQDYESPFERAWVLRQIVRHARLVILYHHPDDPVPVLALSDEHLPPVVLHDHAHSWFWLGSTVIDKILSPSLFHADLARHWRPVRCVAHFPFTQLPDLDDSFDIAGKQKAKERLGIAPDTTCLLTIGTAEKFVPNQQYNFFRTAHAIIKRFQSVELYVIGMDDSPEVRQQFCISDKRIHLMGYISDLTDFYKAADICLDALPQPSLGATLYASLTGLACPMFKYGSCNVFNGRNLFESPLYREEIGVVSTEQDYLDRLGLLIANPDLRIRIAEEIRYDFRWIRSQESLGANLEQMLEEAELLSHIPKRLQPGVPHSDTDSCEIADSGAAQDIRTRVMQFDAWLTAREKLTMLMRLALRPASIAEVLRLAGGMLMRKGRGSIARFIGNRGIHGKNDSVLSAAVSSDSGKRSMVGQRIY